MLPCSSADASDSPSSPFSAVRVLLMAIVMYVWAIFGMALLAGATWSGGTALSVHANFDHVFLAIQTLVRLATGDSWSALYLDSQKLEYADGITPPSILVSLERYTMPAVRDALAATVTNSAISRTSPTCAAALG